MTQTKDENPKVANIKSLEKDFRAFQDETREALSTILEAIAIQTKEATQSSQKIDVSPTLASEGGPGGPQSNTLPPELEEIFLKYFDREDGFDSMFDLGSLTFTIIVPVKLSNASPAYLKYYQSDKRMKALKAGAITEGAESWCKMVVANLKYDKNIKLK